MKTRIIIMCLAGVIYEAWVLRGVPTVSTALVVAILFQLPPLLVGLGLGELQGLQKAVDLINEMVKEKEKGA
jgi:hypothetical protein